MIEFKDFGKIPRLFRRVVITEKIDGNNAAVGIVELSFVEAKFGETEHNVFLDTDGVDRFYHVYAQSRNQIITPEQDNHGFARWVRDNAKELVTVLGPGLHFGEWWGSGIRRGYGLQNGEKRFSLFNTKRWSPHGENALADGSEMTKGLGVVPVLYDGLFSDYALDGCLYRLDLDGSVAAPDFMRPEGIIIYHTAGGYYTKVTLNGDGNKGMDGR